MVQSAFDAVTGAPVFERQRLPAVGNVFGSLVSAAGRLNVTGRGGTTVVVRHGSALEMLATNTLDDEFDASPAFVDDEIYLRGHRYLYSIGVE